MFTIPFKCLLSSYDKLYPYMMKTLTTRHPRYNIRVFASFSHTSVCHPSLLCSTNPQLSEPSTVSLGKILEVYIVFEYHASLPMLHREVHQAVAPILFPRGQRERGSEGLVQLSLLPATGPSRCPPRPTSYKYRISFPSLPSSSLHCVLLSFPRTIFLPRLSLGST